MDTGRVRVTHFNCDDSIVVLRVGRPCCLGKHWAGRPGSRPADRDRSMKLSKNDSRYQPTRAELEEDMRVDASFDELLDAMFGRRPPRRVLH